MARLCMGEFDWPDQRGRQEFLQLLFLDTLAKLDQAPLKQLYDKPFELYRQCSKVFQLDHTAIYFSWRLSGAARSMVEVLKAEIDVWSKAWHLDAKWCRETALDTLHAWSCASRPPQQLFFQHPSGGGGVPTTEDPPPGLPKYSAYSMPREDYLENVRSSVLSAIAEHPLLKHAPRSKANAFADSIETKAKAYCRRVEAVYIEQGWRHWRKSEKRNRDLHLEWTVKFQVGGKTFSEVAKDAKVEQTTVSRAVREMLLMLPLPQRPDSGPGRIRGSKNKTNILRDLGRKH